MVCSLFLSDFVSFCKVFGKNHSFKDALKALPFCILTGIVVGVLYLTMAVFVGPELTSMVAFLTALPILILAAKKRIFNAKRSYDF